VDIKTFSGDGELQLIHGYGDGGFRVTNQRYKGDLVLFPRTTIEWTVPNLETLCFADLETVLGDTPLPDSGREAGGRKEACFALGRGMQNGLTASPCTMNS